MNFSAKLRHRDPVVLRIELFCNGVCDRGERQWINEGLQPDSRKHILPWLVGLSCQVVAKQCSGSDACKCF